MYTGVSILASKLNKEVTGDLLGSIHTYQLLYIQEFDDIKEAKNKLDSRLRGNDKMFTIMFSNGKNGLRKVIRYPFT